jgi:hypothetical protein
MDDIIVEIPGVGRVAFPASMSEQEINEAAARVYGETQAPPMQDQIGRQLGLTGRAAIEGIAALPNIIADPFARAAGITPPSQSLSRTLTRMGLPEPETSVERAVQAGAQAVAGAGGQIGLARQAVEAVTSPITRGFSQQVAQAPGAQLTAAGVAAPTAQQVTEVTESPLAGMAAGVLAGGAAGLRRSQELPPVAKQLRDEANKAYQRAENAGLLVNPNYVQNMASKLSQKAFADGYDPGLHPQVGAVLRRLEDEGASPKTLRELDQLRRIVRAPGGDFNNPDQQRIARNMVDEFDSLVENIGAANVQTAANKDVALSALKQARNVYTKSRRVGIIEDMIDAAQTRGAQQTQAGLDNTLRNQFANLATNKKRMASFTKAEQDEIKRIARGGGNLQQMLRFTGRFAIRGPVSSIPYLLGTGASPEMGGALAMGGLAVTEGAKRGAEALRQRDVSRLIEQIAQQQIQRQPSLVPTTALRGLLSSQQGME